MKRRKQTNETRTNEKKNASEIFSKEQENQISVLWIQTTNSKRKKEREKQQIVHFQRRIFYVTIFCDIKSVAENEARKRMKVFSVFCP